MAHEHAARAHFGDPELTEMLERALAEQGGEPVGWRCHQHFARSGTEAGLRDGLERFADLLQGQYPWRTDLPKTRTGGREREFPVCNRYRSVVKNLTKDLLTGARLKVVKAHIPETKASTARLRATPPLLPEGVQHWQAHLYEMLDDTR